MKKNKVLMASAIVALLSASGAVAGSYAYFSASKEAPASVKMAKVDLEVSIKENSLELYSMDEKQEGNKFENGGEAKFTTLTLNGASVKALSLDRVSPGDAVKFNLGINNLSNIAVAYKISIALADTTQDCPFTITGEVTDWQKIAAAEAIPDQPVSIAFPKEKENEYQDKSYTILINVNAIQANAI